VEAVNALTDMARALTPGKKVLISPYGIFNSDFDDPRYEQQIMRLKVDIIAYQDEIGCVREKYPLPRLRGNWKKLRAIHDKTDIEMWANCESFAWEAATNDRTSALFRISPSTVTGRLTGYLPANSTSERSNSNWKSNRLPGVLNRGLTSKSITYLAMTRLVL
jgi:hypothetical protein